MDHVPENMPDRTVCILGMGFVGVTLAAVMAQIGFDVIGIEVRSELVRRLRAGEAHFFEPGLNEQISAAVQSGRLTVHEQIPADCAATVYIITVGTPLGPDGRTDLTGIRVISGQIAARLRDGDMVVLRSTVRLGATRSVVKPILETSGRQFDLVYCPERTVEGQAMAELRVLPQIIGADGFDAGLRAARLFQFLTPTVVRVSDPQTAEMIKLLDNAARDLIFAYSNEVAEMCDAIGVSADEVIRSGRFGYSRAGLPRPGPVGGPCLSKDGHILTESMAGLGVQATLTAAARRVNEAMPVAAGRQVGELVRRLKTGAGPAEIAVLGVAFKGRPSTDDVRGTTVSLVLAGLRAELPDARFRAWDPIVPAELTATLGLIATASVEQAFDGADAVLIHTDHPVFASLKLGVLAGRMQKPGIIYDFWNLFTETGVVLPEGIHYLSLGSVRHGLTAAGLTES
jgi:UDP-N-acetyl-D-mannosaminuronic acid dehydrogenase